MTEEERLTEDARRVRQETRDLREEGELAADEQLRSRRRDGEPGDATGGNPLAKTSSGDADSITDG